MFAVNKVCSVSVAFLRANCHVRYFEDGTLNGQKDVAGAMPMMHGDLWCPTIDLATGTIKEWPSGAEASIHYKVCDDGVYELLDADQNVVIKKDGYVPSIMCPGGDGYGDYVIMRIGADGKIKDWRVDLTDFDEV